MIYFDLLVQGLIEGSIYALIAVGLTLVYGLLRILHIAHAGIFTLGAYVGLLLTNEIGSFAAAFVITMIAVGFFGMAFYRIFYEPILDKPPHVALIASIGLFVAMEEIFRLIFGATSISFDAPPLKGTVECGPCDLAGLVHVDGATPGLRWTGAAAEVQHLEAVIALPSSRGGGHHRQPDEDEPIRDLSAHPVASPGTTASSVYPPVVLWQQRSPRKRAGIPVAGGMGPGAPGFAHGERGQRTEA